MAEKPSAPTRSGATRLRRRRSSLAPSPARNRGLFLAIVVIFLVGAGLSAQGRDFLSHLYSPIVIVILLFLAIEYIALKGRDRSRIYKIELDQARQKRQEDLEFLRRLEGELLRLENELLQVRKTLDAALEKAPGLETAPAREDAGTDAGASQRSELEQARERLAALRRELSNNI